MGENKITRLAFQKNNPRRINVYLDGEFAFGLYSDSAAWLEVGQILSDEKIKKLLDADQLAEVYQKALDFISFKPRTVFETQNKLERLGYDEALVNETISRLISNGILDDRSYAEMWVEERLRLNPKSKRQLSFELRRKGIPEHLIQSAVEEVDDFQSAYGIAERRACRYQGLSKLEFRKKMGNFLAGKGFSYDVISEITQKLWKQMRSEAD